MEVDCPVCGRPVELPAATWCPECGTPVTDPDGPYAPDEHGELE